MALIKGRSFVLEEVDDSARLKRLFLRFDRSDLMPGAQGVFSSIVIDTDKDFGSKCRFSAFLDKACNHVNKRCDYTIFTISENVLRVFLVDLKSSALGAEGRSKVQFKVGKAFAAYLVDLARIYALEEGSECIDVDFLNVIVYPGNSVATPSLLGVRSNAFVYNSIINDVVHLQLSGVSSDGHATAELSEFVDCVLGAKVA